MNELMNESKYYYFMLHWINLSWINSLIDNNGLTKIWRIITNCFDNVSCFLVDCYISTIPNHKITLETKCN